VVEVRRASPPACRQNRTNVRRNACMCPYRAIVLDVRAPLNWRYRSSAPAGLSLGKCRLAVAPPGVGKGCPRGSAVTPVLAPSRSAHRLSWPRSLSLTCPVIVRPPANPAPLTKGPQRLLRRHANDVRLGARPVGVVVVPPLVWRGLGIALRRVLPLLLPTERGDVDIATRPTTETPFEKTFSALPCRFSSSCAVTCSRVSDRSSMRSTWRPTGSLLCSATSPRGPRGQATHSTPQHSLDVSLIDSLKC
jgi:hypothetical protein